MESVDEFAKSGI